MADMCDRQLIAACGIFILLMRETRANSGGKVPVRVPKAWMDAAGNVTDEERSNADGSADEDWGKWELLGAPPSRGRASRQGINAPLGQRPRDALTPMVKCWPNHVMPPIAVKSIAVHGATRGYVLVILPPEYHKFRQAVDEQWDLTRILTEFVFMVSKS